MPSHFSTALSFTRSAFLARASAWMRMLSACACASRMACCFFCSEILVSYYAVLACCSRVCFSLMAFS